MTTPTSQYTQLRNAQLFADRHADRLQYLHDTKTWVVWDGRRWATDDAAVMQYAKAFVLALLQAAVAITDPDERKHAVAWALECHKEHQLNAILSLARSEPGMASNASEFDHHPYLFNTVNGTLDLLTGIHRPHDPADHLTQLAPVEYDPTATAPRWNRFLDDLFTGRDPVRQCLQNFVGSCLSGAIRDDKLVLPYGPPAGGKSTFVEIIRGLLGDVNPDQGGGYSTVLPFEALAPRRGAGDCAPRNDLYDLRTARLVTAVESNPGRTFDEALLKQLVAGDTIKARQLYKAFVSFRPGFKLLIASNHRPTVSSDPATWRRIALLPFTVTIPPERRDPSLREGQLADERSGILNWALEGGRRWLASGLILPDEVLSATEEYRRAEDVLGEWLAERCDTSKPRSTSPSKALYASYAKWTSESGEEPISATLFGREMSRRGYGKAKQHGQRMGIRLLESPAPEPEKLSVRTVQDGLDHMSTSNSESPIGDYPTNGDNRPKPSLAEQGDAFEDPQPVVGNGAARWE
jgi:putative DNA primase/helicase